MLRGDGTLSVHQSESGLGSDRMSPSQLEHQFEDVSQHGDDSPRPSTSSTGIPQGVPGGILKSAKKKPKSIFKKISYKLQTAVDSIKKKVADGSSRDGSQSPSRSQSFFGAAASFLRGNSQSLSKASLAAKEQSQKGAAAPPHSPVQFALQPGGTPGLPSAMKRGGKNSNRASPHTPVTLIPPLASRSNSSARPSPAFMGRSSSNTSGITLKLPSTDPSYVTPPLPSCHSAASELDSNNSKPPRGSTARVRFSVATSPSSDEAEPRQGPMVRFSLANDPIPGVDTPGPSSGSGRSIPCASGPPQPARRIPTGRCGSGSGRRAFFKRHTSMSGAPPEEEEEEAPHSERGAVRFGSMENISGAFDVAALVREASMNKRARAVHPASGPSSGADPHSLSECAHTRSPWASHNPWAEHAELHHGTRLAPQLWHLPGSQHTVVTTIMT